MIAAAVALFLGIVGVSVLFLVAATADPATPPDTSTPIAEAPAPTTPESATPPVVVAPPVVVETPLPEHKPAPVAEPPTPSEPKPAPPEQPVVAPVAVRPVPMEEPAPRPVVKPNVKPDKPAPDESNTQRVTFLGTVAEGRRFFFIADNSGSMNGVKMNMLKTELALTLKSLKPESRFFITFFNSEAHPLPAKDWQRGERDVPRALQWVAAMGVGGDTNPQTAFDQAFKARPAPDVIFFMTDGQIPAHIPVRVRKLNRSDPKVVIHTILLEARTPQAMQFGLMGADTLLKQIAADSGGTYRQVVVPLMPNPAVMVRPPVVVRPPLPIRRIP